MSISQLGRNERQTSRGRTNPRQNRTEEKKTVLVTLPYVRDVTENVQRAGTQLTRKLRRLQVHPKDKLKQIKKRSVIYEIPCMSCNKIYIWETGRGKFIYKAHVRQCNSVCVTNTRMKHKEVKVKIIINDGNFKNT